MSFLSGLKKLAELESRSDYKVQNPHNGWAVLSMFGPTSENNVARFWKLQRGCEEGAIIEHFIDRYSGRVELALVSSESVGLEYQGKPQNGKNVLVVRPITPAIKKTQESLRTSFQQILTNELKARHKAS